MNEINKEIPEGRRSAEMTLVRMLKKHMSWVDVVDITTALWRIGFIADSLEKEHRRFQSDKDGENTLSDKLPNPGQVR